jgi:hypothetical protein
MFKKFLVIFITFFLITDNLFAEGKSIKGAWNFNIAGKLVEREALFKDIEELKYAGTEAICPEIPDAASFVINYKDLDVLYFAYESVGRCLPSPLNPKEMLQNPRVKYAAFYEEGVRFNGFLNRGRGAFNEIGIKIKNKSILDEVLDIELSPTSSLNIWKLNLKESWDCEKTKSTSDKVDLKMSSFADCNNWRKGINYSVSIEIWSDIYKSKLVKSSNSKILKEPEHVRIAEHLLRTYSNIGLEDSIWKYINSDLERAEVKKLVSLIDTDINLYIQNR